MRASSVIVGMGEVGKALHKILSGRYDVLGIDKDGTGTPCRHLNICIPYSDNFVDIVNGYVKVCEPKLTIIHSTVPVGTTKKIDGLAVNSPVNGQHPGMERGLKTYIKFIGYNGEEGKIIGGGYLGQCFRTCCVENSDNTELMKILCLTRYGLYLEVADEMKKICDREGLDYNIVVNLWEQAYNDGIRKIDPEKRRPIYSPPNGIIGGHCVYQVMAANKEWLDSEMVSSFLSKYKGLALH